MRRSVDSFRGELPRVTPRALPENASQRAVNPRLLSGDAEQWRQFKLTKILANLAAVRTIYLLAGQYWLSWDTDVDVAKGIIPGDTTHRTYITGLDVPRWTNVDMATTGPEPYPVLTRPLGVPPPDSAPTVLPGVDPTPSALTVNVFDPGDQLAQNWTTSPHSEFHGGISQVLQTVSAGPIPSYEVLYDDCEGAPAFLYRNVGVAKLTVARMTFNFMCTSGSNNYKQMISGIMRTQDGRGIAVIWDTNAGALGIATAIGWRSVGNATLASVPVAVNFDQEYTCTVQVIANSDNTQTVTATLFQGSAQLATVTTTSTFELGDYVGFAAETSNSDGADRYRTYYYQILVEGSGSTGYNPLNVATSYLYTFVNDVGEESAPSLPSATVLRPDGVSITVTTPTAVPTGVSSDFGIATKRIYRAVTGATGTAFLFVAEIPLAQAEYIDVLPDSQLGEALESDGWDLPPADLRGILALPNGIMVGFRENEVCLTPKNRPHAWPIRFRLATDKKIVGIGAIDALVVIGTEGNPYLAGGNDPAAYSMTKLQVPQACVSKRSLASLGDFGVVFASPDGLIAIGGTGQWKNLTSSAFTREQWQALQPETITGVAHDDVYHLFYGPDAVYEEAQHGGYALDMKADGFGLIELGYHAVATFADPVTDNLYMVLDAVNEPTDALLPVQPTPPTPDDVTIFQFNPLDGDAFLTYLWRSKLFLLERPGAFQFCRVDANDYDNLVLRIFRQVKMISPAEVWLDVLVYELVVRSDEPFTLPTLNQYRRVWFEVVGTSSVQGVHLGESVEELG